MALVAHAQTPPTLDRSTLDAIPLRLIGPNAPSGRVWSVVGVPSQPKTFYACTAQGGVWRTTNNGITMTPIFDEEHAASCGAVAIAPSDPNVIWVGSGEPAAMKAQVPVEHCSHCASQARLQHFPSAQKPLVHSFVPLHDWAFGFLLTQTPPEQYWVAPQPESSTQPPAHWVFVPSHAAGAQSWSWSGPHEPLPWQVRGSVVSGRAV